VSVGKTIAAPAELSTLNRWSAQAGLADTLKAPARSRLRADQRCIQAVPAKTMDNSHMIRPGSRPLESYHVLR